MTYLIIGGLVAALGAGVWVGIGAPGFPGAREDRVVPPGQARRLKKHHIDLLKPRR
jgi:hypothetical protein